jgi:hypothetical protein
MIYIKFSDGAQGTLMKVGKRWAYTEQKLNDEAHSALLMFLPEEQVQEDQHPTFNVGDQVALTANYSYYKQGQVGSVCSTSDPAWPVVEFGPGDQHSVAAAYLKRSPAKPDDLQVGELVMCIHLPVGSSLHMGDYYVVEAVAGVRACFEGVAGLWSRECFIRVKPEDERIKELAQALPGDEVYCVQEDPARQLKPGGTYRVSHAMYGNLVIDDPDLEKYGFSHRFFQLRDPKC